MPKTPNPMCEKPNKNDPELVTEELRLESIAKDSWYKRTVNVATIEHSFEVFKPYLHGQEYLELGPAEGIMTRLLTQVATRLTVVDGASTFCTELKSRFPGVEVVNALFEEYKPDRQFDNIILGHVLEHVLDPVLLLRSAGSWLTPNGRIFAAVPNARSIHRQAAVMMGLLPSEDALNEADVHHGHRRVFSPESFRCAFYQAGLEIENFGGYWLKPISNRQIEESWSASMLKAFMRLGERYPDIAAEIYVIGRQKPIEGTDARAAKATC